MRIIAGTYRGRKLAVPPGVRPTGDRVREALFSILGGRLDGIFVDAYAGSGAVGLEALSRGARVVFVERDLAAVEVLRRNLDALDAPGATVVEGDVLRALKLPDPAFGSPPRPASWVFCDPPYDYALFDKLLRTLARSPVVGDETQVVVEHRRGVPVGRGELERVRQETYGETTLSFFRRPSRASASESA